MYVYERHGEIHELPISQLRLWPENPRSITTSRLAELKQALEADPEMLWARPLIALPNGTVICGNQRLIAARELGWKTIPVITVDLDRERARLWALRDNATYGVWDEPTLAELLAELAQDGVDLGLTGFETREIDRLLEGLEAPTDPDDVPPPPETPESRLGEVFELGPHRLLCGDARDEEALERLLLDEQAEVVWTDPPYGVDYVGKTKQKLRIQNDQPDGIPQLLHEAFPAVDTVLAPSARIYVASPGGLLGLVFRQAVVEAGWRLHQTLVWCKQTPTLAHSDYQPAHEDILYAWKPGPGRPGRGRHRGSKWYGDNSQTTVFHIDRPSRNADHPTMKPVALIEAMLRNSSRRGDIVLDPFAGSGSTLIACERLGRRCFAVELDPVYCDVIRRRYQEYVSHGR
jgi:DNA modification methylase